MSTEFASAGLTAGQLNDIVKKLGGSEMALRFLRGELSVSEPIRSWREEDGVIYFSVTSDGTTGDGWITRFESKGFRVGKYAKRALRSLDFKPTKGVTTEVAVLKSVLFEDDNRSTKSIRAEADKRKLSKPNAELDRFIREKFTDEAIEQMGLVWIVAMHEPIDASDSELYLLDAGRDEFGCWLNTRNDRPGLKWNRGRGFAFAVSQVCSQT